MRWRGRSDKRNSMDWESLTLEAPGRLWLLPLAALVCAIALWPASRHSLRTRVAALGLRVLVLCGLCLLLALPSRVESQLQVSAPAGTWRLLLSPADPEPGVTEYREALPVFVARIRHALARGTPPVRCQVAGQGPDAALARDAVAALGVPCDLVAPPPAQSVLPPALVGLEAPSVLQPGEPLLARVKVAGNAAVTLLLDGAQLPVQFVQGVLQAQAGPQQPGVHVLEAVLRDAAGNELQRMGHVLRVGERPRLLLLGMTDEQAAQAGRLAPEMQTERCNVENLDAARVQAVQLVMAPIEALYQLQRAQTFALSAFVARGGGLFVTGDGARHVVPDALHDDIRALLPVTLLPEPRPDNPPDPPIEDRPVISNVAKVSVCFVLDRSNSMGALIPGKNFTRWDVAIKGVYESMAPLSLDARASVMTFTLSQTWQAKPQVFLPHNREEMYRKLQRLTSDNEYDDSFFNTDIYAAVKAAIEVMQTEKSAIKLIIMLTDGADRAANSAAGLRHSDLRDLAIKQDINIVAIGIGDAFGSGDPDAAGAQKVITELATRPEFAFLPSSAADAAVANKIFVNSVETAFRAFDDKMKKEEEEHRRRLKEKEDRLKEPPKVDNLAGEFPLNLTAFGESLFGPDALPSPAPKLGWYSRNTLRPEAAMALGLATSDASPPAALAFCAYGLGRVGFWAAGTKPESLGEAAGWADFPALYAASLRWLTPREVPDLKVLAEATPEGITLLDHNPDAFYFEKPAGPEDVIFGLELHDGVLTGARPFEVGAHEIWERLGESERRIGDVYVARVSPGGARVEPAPVNPPRAPDLQPADPRTVQSRRTDTGAVLFLSLLVLMVLPLERFVRRRA